MNRFQKFALFFWFYLGWFGCVFFAKWDWSPWSFVFPLVPWVLFFILNLFPRRVLAYLLALAVVGIAFDLIAFRLSLISFSNHESHFLPYWLLAMWLLFVSVIPLSFDFFKSRLVLAGLLGAIFGPISYFSGEAFLVLTFNGYWSIFIYAVFWSFYFPAAVYFYRKSL